MFMLPDLIVAYELEKEDYDHWNTVEENYNRRMAALERKGRSSPGKKGQGGGRKARLRGRKKRKARS
jgi:hypothetical protein